MIGPPAGLLTEHRLDETEARDVAVDLAYNLPRRAYKLDQPAPAPLARAV